MNLTRRSLFKFGIVSTAAALATKLGSIKFGTSPMSPKTAEAGIFEDPTFQDVYSQIGKYIHLVPGKFAGGVGAYDMSTGACLAWMNMSIWAGK